jgi:hypothetical protein
VILHLRDRWNCCRSSCSCTRPSRWWWLLALPSNKNLLALEQKNSHSRTKDAREAQHREVCRRQTPRSHCSYILAFCPFKWTSQSGVHGVQWVFVGWRVISSTPAGPAQPFPGSHSLAPDVAAFSARTGPAATTPNNSKTPSTQQPAHFRTICA